MGAPYVAASSRRTSAAASNTTTTSSSSMAAGGVTCSAQQVSAVKPHGPWLTHLTVFGEHTKDTTQQLVALLDLLPCSQYLSQLVLQASDRDILNLEQTDSNSEMFGAIWPWGAFKAAVEGAGTDEHPTSTSTSTSSSSRHPYAISSTRNSRPPCGTTTSSSASSSSSPQGFAAAPSAATGPSWRSSCHTLVAGMELCSMQGTLMHLPDLGPLLEAAQQLQVLGLTHMYVKGLPKVAAHMQSLRALHIKWTDISDPGVLGAIAGLTKLRHLGLTKCKSGGREPVCTHIPAAFSALGQLTSLDLIWTEVDAAGLQGVFGLTALKQLNLSRSCHEMAALSSNISRLARLETFKMHDGKIHILPDAMTALTRLRHLEWSTGYCWPLQLEVVWRLRSREHLVIYENHMEVLPAAIGQLTGLTHLCIEAPLEEIHSKLTTLVGLRELLLYAAPDDEEQALLLPRGITALTNLTRVSLPPSQMEHQAPAVRGFMEARLAPIAPGEE